ncbi:Molybdenum cofactor synthesis protein 1 [Entophlyctis luteolus]|nr:Molybdenum cofactor synthesis protein 1 [Entophlyctis luteolus]
MDTFGRRHDYLRISLTEKCNLRCTYCMPASGVPELTPNERLLKVDEVVRLARIFVEQCGVNKIRLTGGEPTVRKDLSEIIEGLGSLRPQGLKSIGMTTNGLALKSRLPILRDAGLNNINISLDTMDPFTFELLTRRRGHQSVVDAVFAALNAGFDSVKLNCVVMKGVNDHEVAKFVDLTKTNDIYVRFIEYMPFDGNQWTSTKFVPYKEILSNIIKVLPVSKCADSISDTSKAYRVEGYKGKFGFITSMSEHFCHTCNRIRLLADGNLKVCLFGNTEVNLLELLRAGASDDELVRVISDAVVKKKERHAGMGALAGMENRAMVRIGG